MRLARFLCPSHHAGRENARRWRDSKGADEPFKGACEPASKSHHLNDTASYDPASYDAGSLRGVILRFRIGTCGYHPAWNPISRLGLAGGDMSSRIASKMTNISSSCFPTFVSSWSSRIESSLSRSSTSRSFTNALIIAIFIWMAHSLLRTLDNIATPCSVKTYGKCLLPPQLEVTNCDLKLVNSLFVMRNAKSSGNLFLFLLTAWMRAFVGTSYNSAKSLSSRTL